MADVVLSPEELELLIGGLSDDIALVWALTYLGTLGNPAKTKPPPSAADIAAAFARIERLVNGGFVTVGDLQPVPGGLRSPDGPWPAPTMHVAEDLRHVRQRVERGCAEAKDFTDWAFLCWFENTRKGDAAAREILATRGDTRPRRERRHDSRPL